MILFEDEFEKDRKYVSTNQEFLDLDEKLIEIRDFLNEFGYLTSNRDILIIRRIGPVCSNIILTSATKTLESIRYCCINANIADAYTLLRKYRDDLFYYLYLLAVADNSDFTRFVELEHLNEAEKNIWNWFNNQQKNLHISSVLKYLATNKEIKKAIERFKLRDWFDRIGIKLNDFVHANGRVFYNKSYNRMVNEQNVKLLCEEFAQITVSITVVFIFLIVIINPFLVMANDYLDYLEFNEIPPEGSQHWVAPFISDFLIKYISVLDENCINYLRERTYMEF